MDYKDTTIGFGAKLTEKMAFMSDPYARPIGFTAKLAKTFSGQADEPPSIGFTAILRERTAPKPDPQLSLDFNAPLLERACANAVMANQRPAAPKVKTLEPV
ncbi:MAG: hypothetical protein HYU57_08135 [Micavibrio aeruginosavorus]|nr:hypothetical protein [Micavibrio aeruginosavorus]